MFAFGIKTNLQTMPVHGLRHLSNRKLPRDIKGKDLKAYFMKAHGFKDAGQSGSHMKLTLGHRSLTVIDSKSLAPGTLKNIVRVASDILGWQQDRLIDDMRRI